MTKGRGFQGVMKRHGFGGGRATHGATVHRAPGSIGAGTNPSRVIKGKKMPGHKGDVQQTVRNLLVAKVDAERNLLYMRGALPGPVNGIVFVRKQGGRGLTTHDTTRAAGAGTARKKVQLPEALFDGAVNEPVMHQAIKAYLANQRQGNASTKTRG